MRSVAAWGACARCCLHGAGNSGEVGRGVERMGFV
jgi:hypothetical protein